MLHGSVQHGLDSSSLRRLADAQIASVIGGGGGIRSVIGSPWI